MAIYIPSYAKLVTSPSNIYPCFFFRASDKSRYQKIFSLSLQELMLWVLIKTSHRDATNEYPHHMFSCRNNKNINNTWL